MSTIHDFNRYLQAHLNDMCSDATHLFVVDLDTEELWHTYVDNIPALYNPLFRKRRVHDCNGCRQFFRRFGNVVSIKDGKVVTVWDFNFGADAKLTAEYQPAIDAAAAYVRKHAISNVYVPEGAHLGLAQNNGLLDEAPHVYYHMHADLPQHILNQPGLRNTSHIDTRNCFERALNELSLYSLEAVNELIAQGTVYRGEEWQTCIREYIKHKNAYNALRTPEARNLYAWVHSARIGESWGRLLNRSIGTLLIDVTAGMDLDTALRRYEKVTAPANYRRPKPVFTAKMLEDAQKTITALGYLESLGRRFATIEDVPVSELLYRSREAVPVKADVSGVFADMLAQAVPTRKPAATAASLERVENISIERFLRDVLPTAKKLEVKVEPRHTGNMVSLIAPVNAEAPSMFTWNNAFSWAYAGNVTDSNIRENVTAAGGRVDGVLRFSIQWNDGSEFNQNDFDAHCRLPGDHIYYGDKVDPRTGGNLDVDIIHPQHNVPAVENITWPTKSRMIPGDYTFSVHCYSNRGGQSGFKGEIEFDGQTFSFEYPHYCTTGQEVIIGTVNLSPSGVFTFRQNMSTTLTTRDVWGVPTNEFTPVTMVMKSPNYWGKDEIGHLHYFFILKDCLNPEEPNGFYNEYMRSELNEHRKVLEALGSRMKVAASDKQVSGVGFSASRHDDIIVRVTGVTSRQFRLEF